MFYIRFMYVHQTTEGDYNTPFAVLNKDVLCGQENEDIQERSRDVPDVVDKKETAFLFVLYKILDIL